MDGATALSDPRDWHAGRQGHAEQVQQQVGFLLAELSTVDAVADQATDLQPRLAMAYAQAREQRRLVPARVRLFAEY